jgi:hypothetical protein
LTQRAELARRRAAFPSGFNERKTSAVNNVIDISSSVATRSSHPPPAPPVFEGAREEWAEVVLAHLFIELACIGISWNTPEGRQIRVALAPMSRTKLGQCHSSKKSVGGDVNMITLSTDQGEPIELVHTLLHELLHALDDCHSGHKGRWARWAKQIGIEMRGHERGPIAEQLVQDTLRAVGVPKAHVQTVPSSRKAGSSQVRVHCPECSKHVNMPRGLADGGFSIACVACAVVMCTQEAA